MKRRRVIILASAVAVIGVCLAMLWPRDGGPEYNGRKLSEWIQRSHSVAEMEHADRAEALESIRAIGDKGIPHLLKWIQYEPPKWRQKLQALMDRLPPGVRGTGIANSLAVNGRENLAKYSMLTLTATEPGHSESVVAELECLSRDLKCPATAMRARFVLRYYEDRGLPPITKLDREYLQQNAHRWLGVTNWTRIKRPIPTNQP